MSQENVEVARKTFEAWNAGDIERLRQLYDPDIIARAPPDWPEPGPFVGRDAVVEQFAQMRETFARDSLDPVSDFLATGNHVIVRIDWRGIGRGPQSDMEMTVAYTVRKGRVFGLEFFWDHNEALEAVGLRE